VYKHSLQEELRFETPTFRARRHRPSEHLSAGIVAW